MIKRKDLHQTSGIPQTHGKVFITVAARISQSSIGEFMLVFIQQVHILNYKLYDIENKPFPIFRIMYNLVQNLKHTIITASTVNPQKIPCSIGPRLSGLTIFGGGHDAGLPVAIAHSLADLCRMLYVNCSPTLVPVVRN